MELHRSILDLCKDILFGVCVGDALGVPVEFTNRNTLRNNPVTGMQGFGTHNKPPGTFSDDSSLTLCLAEALSLGYDLRRTAEYFLLWRDKGYWTADGDVFDIGITTHNALKRLRQGVRPDLAGDFDVFSNGNGSLMRILPLLLFIKDKEIDERYRIIREVSSITHGHVRSSIACFYYLEFALWLSKGVDKHEVYEELQIVISDHLIRLSISADERNVFNRLLLDRIDLIPEAQIYSSGYVVHTLEASIWCLLRTGSYKDAVLGAVNLGEDTDTTAAVTGGLAGMLYGHNAIPATWLEKLARRADIQNLAERLSLKYTG